MPRRHKGRTVHIATVFRWAQRGVRGVRLEVARVGGVTCTTEAAVRRFIAALSAPRVSDPAPPCSAAAAASEDRRAKRDLAKMGI
jgi:hypothetical protein